MYNSPEIQRLINIEVSIKSLQSIIKSDKLKATLWTDDAGIEASELLFDIAEVKQKAKLKITILSVEKEKILKALNDESKALIKKYLNEDKLIKDLYKIY